MLLEISEALTGTTVNFVAIIIGSLVGLLFRRGIPEKIKSIVMQGIALVVIYLGLSMAFESSEILIVIFSMVLGGVVGEVAAIEQRLNDLGDKLKARYGKDEGKFTEGFVSTTLIYCVGALAVVGSLESGLNSNHEILYTKSLLDGTSSIAFSSSLGLGVIFSAIPVFLYQGTIAIFAEFLSDFLAEAVVAEMSAVGGLMIMAIGLNMLNITDIKIANLLPGILVAGVVANIFL